MYSAGRKTRARATHSSPGALHESREPRVDDRQGDRNQDAERKKKHADYRHRQRRLRKERAQEVTGGGNGKE